jgi:hypothetical protein
MNISKKNMRFVFTISALMVFALLFSFTFSNSFISDLTESDTVPFNDIEEKVIFDIVQKAIRMQYDAEKDGLEEVFTNNFVRELDNTFYKSNLKPFEIIKNSYRILEKKKDIYTVSIRIADKNGEYIQVFTIIHKNNGYLIDNIEYDI